MDHEHGRGIADDVLQLGHGEAGVQRQEHRADPAAGELHLQGIRRVQRQHRDPVAALDVELIAQMRGKPRNTGVELCIGEAAFAGEIDNRHLVRRPAAEMGDPVVIANRQYRLPNERSLRRLIGLMTSSLADEEAYGDAVLRGVAGKLGLWTVCPHWLFSGTVGRAKRPPEFEERRWTRSHHSGL
jgi:hypothetical protein